MADAASKSGRPSMANEIASIFNIKGKWQRAGVLSIDDTLSNKPLADFLLADYRNPKDLHMAETSTPSKLLTLILLTGLSVLATNMFLPSLKPISEEFGVSMATASLSLGVYLAITAVLQLIMGPLSDLIGRRPVVMLGLAIFSVASMGCLFSSNYTVFLGFRILQGAVASGMILSRAIVRDTTSGAETVRVLGVIGTAMALAPMLGPVLG